MSPPDPDPLAPTRSPAPAQLPIHHSGPGLGQLVAMTEAAALPLPAPGRAALVLLIHRTHGQTARRPDPFNDRIGILRRQELGQPVPAADPQTGAQHGGSPEEGVLSWWACQGTAEPGWDPMHGTGAIPTHPEGCARLVTEQYVEGAYGGGYHHFDVSRPAFRQVAPVAVERYDAAQGVWHFWGDSRIINANCHAIPPRVDWRKPFEVGVGDNSHACPVPLRPWSHAELLRRGGWTPEIDGVRLDVLILRWDGTVWPAPVPEPATPEPAPAPAGPSASPSVGAGGRRGRQGRRQPWWQFWRRDRRR